MKMIIPTIDPNHFDQKARRIRAQVSTILTKWGLLPRFKRWRLTQDPDTGMIVLFGILHNTYIATHTSIPFSDYFDPRLLHDLASELRVQVVACNSDGLRYAFILDRGQFGRLPTHVDYPFIDNGKLLVRVVYGNGPQPIPIPPVESESAPVDNHTRVDDIKLNVDALQLAAQNPPDIVVIDEDEFKKRVAEQEANRNRQRGKRIRL
jgi:hypothetical protein